jgi:dienelactone hydrolase
LTNGPSFANDVQNMLVPILLLLFDLALPVGQRPPTNPNAARGEAIVAFLRQEKFADVVSQLQPAIAAALTESQLRTAWTGLADQVGAFKQVIATHVVASSGMQVAVVTCQFERALIDVQVGFDAEGRIGALLMRPSTSPAAAAAYTPPPYATPAVYTETDVTVGTGTAWALPGTLTLPVGAGPFPMVVLVHGSGANDRDETVGPNKPFKDLALGLASQGVGVLRYEKRTKQYPGRLAAVPTATVKDEVIDDALAAVTLARSTPRVDRTRVFVLGHSLGGKLAPRIGAADATVKGLIVMAGATASAPQAIVDQMRYMAMLDGKIDPPEQQQIDEAMKVAAQITALTPADAGKPQMYQGAAASYWLDLRGYDPPTAAKDLKQPMLVLQGERDYQVTMADFGKWKAALGGRANVVFHSYAPLNHLFMPGTGPGNPGEYGIGGHVPEGVIHDIATWIQAQR